MIIFSGALKFLALYRFKSTAKVFYNQRTEQNIQLHGPVFGVLHPIRRHLIDWGTECQTSTLGDKTTSSNFPPPGPRGWTCPGTCPRGNDNRQKLGSHPPLSKPLFHWLLLTHSSIVSGPGSIVSVVRLLFFYVAPKVSNYLAIILIKVAVQLFWGGFQVKQGRQELDVLWQAWKRMSISCDHIREGDRWYHQNWPSYKTWHVAWWQVQRGLA